MKSLSYDGSNMFENKSAESYSIFSTNLSPMFRISRTIEKERVINMGTVIKDLGGRRPSIFIERRVDDIETQKLTFNLTNDAWLGTDTGDSIRLFGHDENYNTVEVEIPISISELKESLDKLDE